MHIRGEVFRHHKNRLTQRIRLGNQFYFLKQHHGAGWWEIIRSLLKGHLPVLSAAREYRAIRRLAALGIAAPDICATGTAGWNPATRRSFLLTRELPSTVTLEQLSRHPGLPPRWKWRLIEST